jgi:hypothetical protein
MSERFPLVRSGNGWTEVLDPDPAVEYEAYRVPCMDPNCPDHWPNTLGRHSHVEVTGSTT